MHWKLWYAMLPDLPETYSSEDGLWESAPVYGVICLTVRDPTGAWGRWVHSGYAPPSDDRRGNEFYVKRPDSNQPWATDRQGLELFRSEKHPEDCIKYGAMADQEYWQKVMDRAAADTDFPTGSPRRRATDY